LSNFSKSSIVVSGVEYPTAEHAFQACKTMDGDIRKQIAVMETPGEAKKAGQRCKLLDDWDDARLVVMYDVLRKKFTNRRLAGMLKATGNAELIEGNYWHDNFWGNCACWECSGIDGENMLGELLMLIRNEL